MPCKQCGEATSNPTYCSNACQQDHAWTTRKRAIEVAGSICSGNPRLARRYLIEIGGHACKLCGGWEWLGKPMPLVLDHIDGDAGNWRLPNLRMICPNCDAQLPTFKSRNWGKGRVKRRERYASGLSY